MNRFNSSGFSVLLAASFLVFTSCGDVRSDEEIAADIKQTLSADQPNGPKAYTDITTSVKDGVVTLNGLCEGDNCGDSVEARINDINGVKEVVNNVQQTARPTDLTLRTSVQTVISKYQGVQADVAEGVVVLRGTILRDQIQPLMNELSTLKATKIDNQLAIK